MPTDELTRRLRAARGYAGLSQLDLAEELGMSESTYKRTEATVRGMKAYERDGFLRAVAEATEMPRGFFDVEVPLAAAFARDVLKALEQVLRATTEAFQEQRREREATSEPPDETDHRPQAEGGDGA
jgi:transcriptional regulator with XRE-family HTH domain